jgi:hypothetical protein
MTTWCKIPPRPMVDRGPRARKTSISPASALSQSENSGLALRPGGFLTSTFAWDFAALLTTDPRIHDQQGALLQLRCFDGERVSWTEGSRQGSHGCQLAKETQPSMDG